MRYSIILAQVEAENYFLKPKKLKSSSDQGVLTQLVVLVDIVVDSHGVVVVVVKSVVVSGTVVVVAIVVVVSGS